MLVLPVGMVVNQDLFDGQASPRLVDWYYQINRAIRPCYGAAVPVTLLFKRLHVIYNDMIKTIKFAHILNTRQVLKF